MRTALGHLLAPAAMCERLRNLLTTYLRAWCVRLGHLMAEALGGPCGILLRILRFLLRTILTPFVCIL